MYRNVQGTPEPAMEIRLTVNGEAVDISDALDHVLRWRKPDGTVTDVALLAIDLATGRLKRVWSDGDTDMIGDHEAQVIVTRANGKEQVFPSDGTTVHWRISPRLVIS
jgi:hypothetical protein